MLFKKQIHDFSTFNFQQIAIQTHPIQTEIHIELLISFYIVICLTFNNLI